MKKSYLLKSSLKLIFIAISILLSPYNILYSQHINKSEVNGKDTVNVSETRIINNIVGETAGLGKPIEITLLENGGGGTTSGHNSVGYENTNEISYGDFEKIYSTIGENGHRVEYATSNKMNELKDFNYLFLSFILVIFSIYILHISSESWIEYESNVKKNDYKEKIKTFISEREYLLKNQNNYESERMNRLIDKIEIDKKDAENSLDEVSIDKSDIYKKNVLFIILGLVILMAYFELIFELKGLPTQFFTFELFNYPLQFASPLVLVSLFFSLVSILRFTLIQGGNTSSASNKFSFFGIIISVISLTASIMTMIMFMER